MPVDNLTFQELVDDSRYDLLKQKIKIDRSNRSYELLWVPPATTKGSYVIGTGAGATTWACWNDSSSTHYIDLYSGSDYKTNLQGSYIQLSYYACQQRLTNAANYTGCPIATTGNNPQAYKGYSLPFNPLYFFQTIALKINQNQTPLEQYINANNLQHISTLNYLLNYKKDALESNDQTMFTPCIETSFDTQTSLSEESKTRGERWLGSTGLVNAARDQSAAITNNTPKRFTKIIPLSDIFNCAQTPAIWSNITRLRLEFTLRLPDKIAFSSFDAAEILAQNTNSTVYIVVDDIQIIYDATRMGSMQNIQVAEDKKAGLVENVGFLQNECIPWSYTSGSQVIATSMRDLQMAAFGILALGQRPTKINGVADTNVCVNPIQYINGNITTINMSYGGDQPLRTPLRLYDGLIVANASTNQSIYSNTSAYMLYKKCCAADRSSLLPVALSFVSFPMYHLFCFPVYNMGMPIHKNNDPKDVRFDNQGSTSLLNVPSVIILRKFCGLQLDALGNVEKV